jgi:hypothetical protein
MALYINQVTLWSRDNQMNINWKKTKEMFFGRMSKCSVPQLFIDNNAIVRVNCFKLLGVNIDDKLKWNSHVNSICSKASARLYFLKQLKRSAVSSDDLVHFYITVIRSVLEYACPAWHTSLTAHSANQIESVQKRAINIIYSNCNYREVCAKLNLPTLFDRREELCKTFFKDMLKTDNCLHYLLPQPRQNEIVSKLRHYDKLVPPTAKTVRNQKSFVVHALQHYQH